MSFPRYPKYKASGVEWLGEVPDGWEVKPLRSVFKFSKGLTITKEDLRDEGVCCVNYGEIHSKYGFRLNPKVHPLRCVEPEYLNSNPDALIRDGDFVFADTSEDLEGSGNFTHLRSENPIFAGYHTIIGRPQKGISSLLMAYQIHSSAFRSQIQRQVKGVKVFSISQGILKAAKCLLPPLPEQTAIAEFLDRETGKIDGLVAEQRRLMELLKQKRQAVISHAVTKGLNPHAPMKPSGIEWLGDVPEHWDVMPVGYRYSIQLGKMLDSSKITGEHLRPYLRVFDVQWGEINTDDLPLMDFDELSREKFLLKSGDLLVNEGGSYPGRSAIWRGGIDECYYQKALHRLRPHSPDADTTAYLYFVMVWAANQGVFVAGGNETTIEHLPAEKLRKYRFPSPPISEQLEIAKFLDTELAKFDTLTAEAQRAIDLLQERRTALISAAVTGQIDVRQQIHN